MSTPEDKNIRHCLSTKEEVEKAIKEELEQQKKRRKDEDQQQEQKED